jgi:hypothetical protein
MSGYNPHSERHQRYARRASSALPLSELEKAEQRHYRLQDYWRQLYVFGPPGIAAAITFLAGNDWRFFPFEVVASWSAFVLGAALTAFLSANFKTGPGLWIRLQIWTHGIGGAIIMFGGVSVAANGAMSAVAGLGVALVGLVVMAWPHVYAGLRRRWPSDFERYLASSQAPLRGIME